MRFKLNLLISLLMTGILLASSAFSYYRLRADLYSAFEGRKKELVKRLQVNLPNAVWNFDELQIASIVEAEMNSPDLLAIHVHLKTSSGVSDAERAVVSRTRNTTQSGTVALSRLAAEETMRVPLYMQSRVAGDSSVRKSADMGYAVIELSRQHVEQLLAEQLRNRIIEIIILNFLLGVVLFTVMSRMVTTPLAKMSLAFKSLARTAHAGTLDIKGDDEFGEVVSAFNQIVNRLLSDIHRRREAEKKLIETNDALIAAQSQLLQSEKMAAIGQLAAGVAHEINNPIGFVNSNLGTLKTYSRQLLEIIAAYERGVSTSIEQARQDADLDFLRTDLPMLLIESLDGLSRVSKIVQNLKDYSRINEVGPQITDLNAALESTLNVVWHELKYKANVIRELGDIPLVECMPGQINQVFTNLLINAAHAINEHGKIVVRSCLRGDMVYFEIEDTGQGMSEEIRRRIFEPFFTTKPVGAGTGLGLFISYDIVVNKHGGRLEVCSEPGKGSCFTICLPLVFKGNTNSESKLAALRSTIH